MHRNYNIKRPWFREADRALNIAQHGEPHHKSWFEENEKRESATKRGFIKHHEDAAPSGINHAVVAVSQDSAELTGEKSGVARDDHAFDISLWNSRRQWLSRCRTLGERPACMGQSSNQLPCSSWDKSHRHQTRTLSCPNTADDGCDVWCVLVFSLVTICCAYAVDCLTK
ncbi:Phospho-2-dehydro-3-deoxyheptonate aldolase AMT16 [Fusarium oxysporum f. sp. albedinis]|nr:Phospho-2-dehydro-3-deoxyheptonate aldolase AMT16 [Fusarium oxysporum f. sp. albedinis]